MSVESSQFVKWFRSTSPYIHIHRRRTFVVKFDDAAVQSGTFNNLIHDLALLNSLGIQLILVFGTRLSIEKLASDRKLSTNFHKGMRITDIQAMEYVKEAVGKLRIEIEAKLSMGLGNTPMSNAELRVSSGNYVTAKPLGIVDGVDFHFTGEIRSIDVESIRTKLNAHEIVLIPPLGYSTTGESFNLSADTLAARIASELYADKLVYLMEARGLTNKNGELIRQMNQDEAEALLKCTDEKADSYRYIQSAVNACKTGVKRIHLLDRRLDGAILQELFTRDGAGTMISTTPYDVVRQATVDDIPGLINLIEPLENEGVLVARSREKLELEINHFTVLERDGVVIGCVALYPFEKDNAAELACLVIHSDYHNGGHGDQLLSLLEHQAISKGIKTLFVLTTHAEHWFLEHGFVNTDMNELPVERQTLYNYQRNSKVLVKHL